MPPWTHYRRQKGRKRYRARDSRLSHAPLSSLGLDNADPPEKRAAELRLFLQDLGGVYSCFGLYLSSRIDLLPAEYCREFSLIPDHTAPIPAAEVLETLAEELGGPPELNFPRLNLSPSKSSLIAQYHEAELANGIPVFVVIGRREFRSLEKETADTALLDLELLQKYCPELVVENAVEDFLVSFRRKVDLGFQAEKLELMARDAVSTEALEVPKVYRTFCTRRVLTMARLQQEDLDQILESKPFSAARLATLICYTWLRQSLFGRCCAVDPQHHNIAVSGGHRVSYIGCDLVSLPKRTRDNLWNYLLATTTDDPDQAAMFLLREMSGKMPAQADPEGFRSSFRQAAYFGALEPLLGTDTNALAQLIFQHWQTALGYGYTPNADLLSFYRGLFLIARIGRKLFPAGDPLRHAIEEIRVATLFEQAQHLADLPFIFSNFDKFVIAGARLPTALDDAVSRASWPRDSSLKLNQPDAPGRERQSNRSMNLLAFALLVATACLSQSALSGQWTFKVVTLVLMLTGLVVLRTLKD